MAININHEENYKRNLARMQKPAPLNYIFPGGWVRGTVAALVSAGGTGKSMMAMELACSLCAPEIDNQFLNLSIPNNPNGTSVRYFALEDQENILHHRMFNITRELDETHQHKIARNLYLESVFGKGMDIMNDDHLNAIIKYCSFTDLIIFDTLNRVHSLDENNNGEMSLLLRQFEYLAKELNTSILYLHHTSKNASFNGQTDSGASRGASALIDNARWAGVLTKITEEEAKKHTIETGTRGTSIFDAGLRDDIIKFTNAKNNYARRMDDKYLIKEADSGVLSEVTLYPFSENSDKGGKKHDKSPY